MEIFKQLINFFKKNYILFLALVVVLSYGQLLGMHVWQDDNALFFKLSNIEGKAGYLGTGPIGQGAYKYTVTPYIPIYRIFGFNTIPYFLLTLTFYFVTSVFVYKAFSKIFGEKVGRISGFLYAVGYIAADGYIRLFNSLITNLSVILISLLFLFLWRFTKELKIKWYFLGLLVFWAVTEFALARSHYLVSIVIVWELLFNFFKKPMKSIYQSLLRLVPYSIIFYYYFIVGADERSGQVKVWISKILSGDFSQTYSLISSLNSLIFPNWLTDLLFKVEETTFSLVNFHLPLFKLAAIGTVFLTSIFLFKKRNDWKLISGASVLLSIIWAFASERIYSTTRLNLGYRELSLVFLGGVVLLLGGLVFLKIKKYRALYLFFVFWALVNLAAYSAYNPSVYYESINRYLSHSFFALIGICAVFLFEFEKEKRIRNGIFALVILWGLGNLSANIIYQKKIIETRANPARSFYSQLRKFTPEVKKGDVFYFDVDQSARGYFNEAFSVAQMPETTAIAWRYGLDRYDIKMFTNFDELEKEIESGGVALENLHAFWYKNLELIETTETLKNYFTKTGRTGELIDFQKIESKGALGETITTEGNFEDVVGASAPLELSINLSASPLNFTEGTFPLKNGSLLTSIHKNTLLRPTAFEYKKAKENILKTAIYKVTSQWRERVVERLHDGDITTYWQADRILFRNKNEGFTIDLGRPRMINKFVFINGFANNSPTDYSIEVSLDEKNWKEVKRVTEEARLEPNILQILDFPITNSRFIKMSIRETLNSDSPTISEAWPVYSNFSDFEINEVEAFLKSPFSFLLSQSDYYDTLSLLENKGEAQVYWVKERSGRWETTETSKLTIFYDGIDHLYRITIPAGGFNLTGLRIGNFVVPGGVVINSIQVR